MAQHTIIAGTGSALPRTVVTNNDLARRGLETSDSWIRERTGIGQRHVCEADETTATLATTAAERALAAAGVGAKEIDLVIVATATPDYSFPSVAHQVQQKLGLPPAPAFDIQAACSGFIHGLCLADMFLQSGRAKNVLLIGAEAFSRLVDWEDRNTCVLFGDGAGAVVLQRREGENGLLGVEIFGDGSQVDLLRTTGGVGSTGTMGRPLMNGREVFRHAVRAMAEVVPLMLAKYGVRVEEIDHLVPHQANARIIEATAKLLKLPMEKVVMTVEQHANTSAASVPLALDTAARQGRFKPGDLLFLEAFGAGFAWSAALLRWGKE